MEPGALDCLLCHQMGLNQVRKVHGGDSHRGGEGTTSSGPSYEGRSSCEQWSYCKSSELLSR